MSSTGQKCLLTRQDLEGGGGAGGCVCKRPVCVGGGMGGRVRGLEADRQTYRGKHKSTNQPTGVPTGERYWSKQTSQPSGGPTGWYWSKVTIEKASLGGGSKDATVGLCMGECEKGGKWGRGGGGEREVIGVCVCVCVCVCGGGGC